MTPMKNEKMPNVVTTIFITNDTNKPLTTTGCENTISKKKIYDSMRYQNRKEYLKQKASFYRRKNPEKRLLQRAKSRAKKNNIPFDIDLSDITIPTTCPVLGIELKLNSGRCDDSSPSLDRINPSLGYVKSNVSVISNRANNLKRDGTLKEFQQLVEYLTIR